MDLESKYSVFVVEHKKKCAAYLIKNYPNIIQNIKNRWELGESKEELRKLFGVELIRIALKNCKKKVHLSEQAKQKISKHAIKFFSEHPDRLPYRLYYRLYHSSKLSYVEELFKQALIKNNISGWTARYQIGIYEYDIAFVDIKVDVEIDGKSHELDVVKQKDQKRDNWSKSNGWEVLRFTASEVKKDIDKCLLKLSDTLKFAGSSNGKILGS